MVYHVTAHEFNFPEAPITMSQVNTTMTALEGNSTDLEISCTSSGNPIPTISWELDGFPAPFPWSNTVTHYPPTVPNFGEFSFTTGSVTSELKITGVNTSHEGEYTCTARNSHRGVESSSSSTITVHVLGEFQHNIIDTSLIPRPHSLWASDQC